MSKKGGYVIVDLKGQSITAGTPFTLDGVTARLDRAKNKACLLSGFAIGDEEKRDVFVDLQPTEDGYVALFGQYTITIEDDEVTITDGGVLLENIVDSQGHKRFIEGTISKDGVQKEDVTLKYAKWSLSGSHLQIVIAGYVNKATTIDHSHLYFNFNNLPSWVANKIYPLIAENNGRVTWSTFVLYDAQFNAVNGVFGIQKYDNIVSAYNIGQFTTTADETYFRIGFDLLIDTAE